MQTTAIIVALVLFVLGLLGTVLPILPCAILIYGGMFLYGVITQFSTLDANFFLIQALILVLILAIDFLASAAGTRQFEGSRQAVWGAVIGTVLGLLVFGPLGIIIGPFLGAVIAEFMYHPNLNHAIRVGFGTLIGFVDGTILKLGVEIIMIIYFFIKI
ncbi:MAG TPA: DUF456 domain-containing protein [Desulfitobacteriaceae bacterium]|nr:DUF456 domain-containing protein [Desulfitobacteriaceae bacterium]